MHSNEQRAGRIEPGSRITSDAGLLPIRELDDALGPSALSADVFADARIGGSGRHALADLLRQPVFARLVAHDHVSDAKRLRHAQRAAHPVDVSR